MQEWWLSDRLYILKDRPAVFGNPDYQMNSSSVQKQLKEAGIDTNSKKYKAALSEMITGLAVTDENRNSYKHII